MRTTSHFRTQLAIQVLEDRCVPSYVVADYGKWQWNDNDIKGNHIPVVYSRIDGLAYSNSTHDITELPTMPPKELMLLKNSFPAWTFNASKKVLPDKTMRIKEYLAFIKHFQVGNEASIGAELAIQLELPVGMDPKTVHWIQTVDRTYAPIDIPMAPDRFVDNGGVSGKTGPTATPYFSETDGNSKGFYDFPTVNKEGIREDFYLFLVEETGPKTVLLWQGLHWGWIKVPETWDAPDIRTDDVQTLLNTPVVIDVVANDAGPQGIPLGITNISSGAHGRTKLTTLNGSPEILYTPDSDFVGDDSFTYTGSDGANAATTTVTVHVHPLQHNTISITSLGTTSGASTGGTSVVLLGSNFTGATAVSFGGIPAASFTIDSASQITAVTPAHTAGICDVAIIDANGMSAPVAADRFTYTAASAPTISSLGTTTGTTAGGTSVTITGTNFTGATDIYFGKLSATSFTVNSATSITATSPPQYAGTVDITVFTPGGGVSAVSSSDTFTYTNATLHPFLV